MANNRQDNAQPISVLRISTADMAALKVRIRGNRRPEPPEFFYQQLPPEGIALLATIPDDPTRKGLAVSIPSRNCSWHGGWPLSAKAPESASGSILVYRLQPDCRYAAIAVRERGHDYSLEEFVAIARHRLRNQFGNPGKIPGRYIYASPHKEEWGNILRDYGYAALNPAPLAYSDKALVLLEGEAEQYGHNISIRAPIYFGDKLSGRYPLPVFTRVEILSRDAAGAENRWVSFDEYQKIREEAAIVPEPIAAGFGEWLARLTMESGFDGWRFRPGMAFGERTEWWGPRGRRRTVHEGLDFVEGFRCGKVMLIPEGVTARALASGEVAATLDDFMGKTVVLRHPSLTLPGGEVFHTLLCHIQTEAPLPSFVKKGETLGRVGRRAGIRIRPHLHLSCGWFPNDFPFAKAGIDTSIHPGFTPTKLTNINNLIETSPLCVRSSDDREFLADDYTP